MKGGDRSWLAGCLAAWLVGLGRGEPKLGGRRWSAGRSGAGLGGMGLGGMGLGGMRGGWGGVGWGGVGSFGGVSSWSFLERGWGPDDLEADPIRHVTAHETNLEASIVCTYCMYVQYIKIYRCTDVPIYRYTDIQIHRYTIYSNTVNTVQYIVHRTSTNR